jgi:molecular chaperone GrpE
MTRIPIDDENVDSAEAREDRQQRQDRDGGGEMPGGERGAGEELEKLRAERDSLFERLARATADFQNSRKRLEAEMEQRLQYANSGLIKTLLPVMDNFERALAVDPNRADSAAILKGLQIVYDQLIKSLRDQKVQEIAPAPGEPFDPTRHEALMQQDAPQFAGRGPTVTQLLQKGYALHDRTLRPAQVAVSRTS